MLLGSRSLRKALTSHLSAWQHLKCAEGDFGQLMEPAGASKDIGSLDNTLQMGSKISISLLRERTEATSGIQGGRWIQSVQRDDPERKGGTWRCQLAPSHPLSCCSAVLLPCLPSAQLCFPAWSTAPNRNLPGAVCILTDFSLRWGNLFSSPLLDYLLTHGSSSTTCAVTFWGTRQEKSSWLK